MLYLPTLPGSPIFIQYLRATHTKVDNDVNKDDDTVHYTDHTCIIIASMRYINKKSGTFNCSIYNRLLNECRDTSIQNPNNYFVEFALKFFHNILLIILDNVGIDEGLGNVTPCQGLYIKLNEGVTL